MPWTEITRPQYARRGQRYASDSSDEEWALIDAAPVGSQVGAAAQGLPAIHDRASDARQRPDQRGADGRGVASGRAQWRANRRKPARFARGGQ